MHPDSDIISSTFSVSARTKHASYPISKFLLDYYSNIKTIDGVFGFTDRTPLNGGRKFTDIELSQDDISWLTKHDIRLKLPLSNPHVDEQAYRNSWSMLEKYVNTPTTIMVSNDKLAGWIRRDFPCYYIEASVIRNIRTVDSLVRLLEIYDSAVLPSNLNNGPMLDTIPDKSRVRLFANAGCPHSCPSTVCYSAFGRQNRNEPVNSRYTCARQFTSYNPTTFATFDVDALVSRGFSQFKLTHQSTFKHVTSHVDIFPRV